MTAYLHMFNNLNFQESVLIQIPNFSKQHQKDLVPFGCEPLIYITKKTRSCFLILSHNLSACFHAKYIKKERNASSSSERAKREVAGEKATIPVFAQCRHSSGLAARVCVCWPTGVDCVAKVVRREREYFMCDSPEHDIPGHFKVKPQSRSLRMLMQRKRPLSPLAHPVFSFLISVCRKTCHTHHGFGQTSSGLKVARQRSDSNSSAVWFYSDLS